MKDLLIDYPQIYKIASIICCIPVSSAACERGFSKMSLIKTSHRNRELPDIMDACMGISIEGPDILNMASLKWGAIGERFNNKLGAHSQRYVINIYIYIY